MKIKMMRLVGTTLVTLLMTMSAAQADNALGSIPTNIIQEEQLEISFAAIEKSKAFRKSFKSDRSIAGMSSDEIKWAKEFDVIMADNQTDYLSKSYQLND